VDSIYQAHFGLTGEPFNNTPDAHFLYRSASHREALAQLSYGINARKGFVVLTGEVGTGKTLLIHTLLQQLDRNTKTALIFNTVVNGKDLLRYVCEEFELVAVQEEVKEVHDYVVLINHFLLESYRKRENVALIIDEAQNLPAEVLESIRLLSNFETPQDKLLQIVLAGQPELTSRLNSPALRQLKQRVVLRHHLKPLSFADCVEYINKRLNVVGGHSSIFAPAAIETIYLYSNGVPRLINILADNGMLTAYALGKKIVDSEMIREIGHDLHLSAPFGEFGGARKENSQEQNFAFLNVKGTAEMEKPVVREAAAVSGGRTNGSTTHAERNGNVKVVAAESLQSRDTERVPQRFFESMISELTDAMGPMATVVAHDHAARLGESLTAFPRLRVAELVQSASEEILSERSRIRFLNWALEEMRTVDLPEEEQSPEKPLS
jgi:type II secretory pathway predicted ATPase ExeA